MLISQTMNRRNFLKHLAIFFVALASFRLKSLIDLFTPKQPVRTSLKEGRYYKEADRLAG